VYRQRQQFNAIKQRATCFGYSRFNSLHHLQESVKIWYG